MLRASALGRGAAEAFFRTPASALPRLGTRENEPSHPTPRGQESKGVRTRGGAGKKRENEYL